MQANNRALPEQTLSKRIDDRLQAYAEDLYTHVQQRVSDAVGNHVQRMVGHIEESLKKTVGEVEARLTAAQATKNSALDFAVTRRIQGALDSASRVETTLQNIGERLQLAIGKVDARVIAEQTKQISTLEVINKRVDNIHQTMDGRMLEIATTSVDQALQTHVEGRMTDMVAAAVDQALRTRVESRLTAMVAARVDQALRTQVEGGD